MADWWKSKTFSILLILLILLVVWYLAAIWLNAQFQLDTYRRANVVDFTWTQFVLDTWSQTRAKLPAPHQVLIEFWNTTFAVAPTDNRGIVYHGWVTLSATLLGFIFGTALGIGLAVLIVYNRASDKSLMPWLIASQAVPIMAIAPMIVVVSFTLLTGRNPVAEFLDLTADSARLVSKALISMYLSFFPVVVGMVKGLRSPEPIQLDLMRTYSASPAQVFWKLRWPIATPFLFVSMKIGVAASLIGAIVGELPTGAVAGLGSRLSNAFSFGQTAQIWATLLAASILAGTLVGIVGFFERQVLARSGARPA